MEAATLEIVGRDEELAAIDGFLAGGVPALLIEGEAGIGKTTLWRYGRARGRDTFLTLVASPTSVERALTFVAAGDLLGPHIAEVSGALPGPQRRAVTAAFLLGDDIDHSPPDARAVALGFLGALRQLARRRPVLVAVDDAQWLDESSAMLLEFALRRVGDDPIRFLLAQRVQPGDVPLRLDRSRDVVRRLPVGPLSLGSLHRLLRTKLDASFPRPLLHRIHETSGGNPFYALELARLLGSGEAEIRPGLRLPLPDTLAEAVRDRISRLPPDVRIAVGAVAALRAPTVAAVGADSQLAAAARAGVLEIDGDRVTFTHPLLAEAAYAAVPPLERRALHGRLADLVSDSEERARHLALAATGTSGEVADMLEQAASGARDRGAPAAAGELLELSASLTPEARAVDTRRRQLEAARQWNAAGDTRRSRGLLETLLRDTQPGLERCDVLLALAETREDDFGAAFALSEAALHEAGSDPARRARASAQMSSLAYNRGDVRGALRHARASLADAETAGDVPLLVAAIATVALLETWRGTPTAGLLERGVELESCLGDGIVDGDPYKRPSFVRGLRLMYADRIDESRSVLEEHLAIAGEHGNEAARGVCLFHLAELEWRAGRWARALERAEEALEIAESAGMDQSTSAGLFVRSLVLASLGRAEEARSDARRGVAVSEAVGDETFRIQNLIVLGVLELSLGNARDAATILAPLCDALVAHGHGEPTAYPVLPNAIEALIATGDRDEAARLLAQLDQAAKASRSPWAVAAAARCRGLLAAADGGLDAALSHLRHALRAHEQLPNPLERGRTLLAIGIVHRRRKEKRAAREALASACETFDELGARLWAEAAQAELARIGGRTSDPDQLTETEQRVADLVSAGRTNKEVAAELFVSVRAVEANLTRIYGKLGIRSRTELASRLIAQARK